MAKQVKTGEFGVLEVINDSGTNKTLHPLKPGVCSIGSGLNVNIRLRNKDVQDLHCIVHVHENGVATVTPQSTFNPTKLNNKLIRKDKNVLLKHGDFIMIGDVKILYKNDSLTEQEVQQKGKSVINSKMFNTPRLSNITKHMSGSSSLKKRLPVSRLRFPQRRFSSGSASSDQLLWDAESIPDSLLPSERNVSGDALVEDGSVVNAPDKGSTLGRKISKAGSSTPNIRKSRNSVSTDSTGNKTDKPWTRKSLSLMNHNLKKVTRRKSVSDLTTPILVSASQSLQRNKSFAVTSCNMTDVAEVFKTPMSKKSSKVNPEKNEKVTTSTPVPLTTRSKSISTSFVESPRKSNLIQVKSVSTPKLESGNSEQKILTPVTSSSSKSLASNSFTSTSTLPIVNKDETIETLNSTLNSEGNESWETGSRDNLSALLDEDASYLDTTGSSSFVYEHVESDSDVNETENSSKSLGTAQVKDSKSSSITTVETFSKTLNHSLPEDEVDDPTETMETDEDDSFSDETEFEHVTADAPLRTTSDDSINKIPSNISGVENLTNTPRQTVQGRNSRNSARKTYSAAKGIQKRVSLRASQTLPEDTSDSEDNVLSSTVGSIKSRKSFRISSGKGGEQINASLIDLSSPCSVELMEQDGIENLAKTPKQKVEVRNSRSFVKSGRKTVTEQENIIDSPDSSSNADDDQNLVDQLTKIPIVDLSKDRSIKKINKSLLIDINSPFPTLKLEEDVELNENCSKTPKQKVQVRNSRSAVKPGRKTYSGVLEKKNVIASPGSSSDNDEDKNTLGDQSTTLRIDLTSNNRSVKIINKSSSLNLNSPSPTSKSTEDVESDVSGIENSAQTPKVRNSRSFVNSGRKSSSAVSERKNGKASVSSSNTDDDENIGQDVESNVSTKTPKQKVQVRNSRSAVKSGRKSYSVVSEKKNISHPAISFSNSSSDDDAENTVAVEDQSRSFNKSMTSPLFIENSPQPSTSMQPDSDLSGTENQSKSVQVRNSRRSDKKRRSRVSSKIFNNDVSSDSGNEEEDEPDIVEQTPKITFKPSRNVLSKSFPVDYNSPSTSMQLTDEIEEENPVQIKNPRSSIKSGKNSSIFIEKNVSPLIPVPGFRDVTSDPENTDQSLPQGTNESVRKTPKHNPKKTSKPRRSPKNDLSRLPAIKHLFEIPKSPLNSLMDVRGVKKIMRTPKIGNPPKNDLRNVPGFKHIFETSKSPKNDLSDVRGVRGILKTPKTYKSPRNDLRNVPEFKKMFDLPKPAKNNLDDLEGVEELMKTPAMVKRRDKSHNSSKQAPRSDYTDVRGVKRMFGEEEGKLKNIPNVSGIAELFNDDTPSSSETFTALFNKKPLRTYRSKSTSPNKSNQFGNGMENLLVEPTISPDVVNWVNAVNQELVTNTLVSPNKEVLKTQVAVLKRSNRIASRSPTPSTIIDSPRRVRTLKEKLIITSTPNNEVAEELIVKKNKTGILKGKKNIPVPASPRGRRNKNKDISDTSKENMTPNQSDSASDAQTKKVKFQIETEETRRSQRTPRKPAKLEGFISESPSKKVNQVKQQTLEKDQTVLKKRKRGGNLVEKETDAKDEEESVVKKNRKNTKHEEDKSETVEDKKPVRRGRGKKINVEAVEDEKIEEKDLKKVEEPKGRPTRGRKPKIQDEDPEEVLPLKKRGRKPQVTEKPESDLESSVKDEKEIKTHSTRGRKLKKIDLNKMEEDKEETVPIKKRGRKPSQVTENESSVQEEKQAKRGGKSKVDQSENDCKPNKTEEEQQKPVTRRGRKRVNNPIDDPEEISTDTKEPVQKRGRKNNKIDEPTEEVKKPTATRGRKPKNQEQDENENEKTETTTKKRGRKQNEPKPAKHTKTSKEEEEEEEEEANESDEESVPIRKTRKAATVKQVSPQPKTKRAKKEIVVENVPPIRKSARTRR